MFHFVNILGQRLIEYSYTSGGGMLGGFYSLTVRETDADHAMIRIEKSETHADDPVIETYTVPHTILEELERVARKHHMNFWHRKKFTNLFIADGESRSHSFRFEKNGFNFSSQHYPGHYGNSLAELREITTRYTEAAKDLS